MVSRSGLSRQGAKRDFPRVRSGAAGLRLSGATAFRVLAAAVLLGVAGGFLLAGGGRSIARQVDPQQRALFLARQEALQPWRIAGGVALRMAGIVLLLGAVGCLVGAAAIGLQALALRARLVRPGRNGLFPIVELGRGVLYDPNRDNAGAHPVIAAAALDVQRMAALSSGARLNVSWHAGGSGTAPSGEIPATLAPNLPDRMPLRALLGESPSLARLVLGVTVDDQSGQVVPVTGDMADLVHIAVGGSSGWGKSVFLRSLAYQMALAKEQPDLVAIDLEGVTLSPLAQSSRLLYPLAGDESEAQAVLEALTDELERRKSLFSEFPGVDSLARYNVRAKSPLRPVILLCDEATALLGDPRVEDALKAVTLRARKYGLWAVLAGQDWKASSLDTAIRNQLSTRVQFKAMSSAQSRVLLGQSGAEDLAIKGRALAVLPGRELLELQAPLVSGEMLAEALQQAQVAGPQLPMPAREAASAESDVLIDDPELADDRRVLLLHQQGLSMRQIERRVFGYTGGSAHDSVKRAIEAGSSTGSDPAKAAGERA